MNRVFPGTDMVFMKPWPEKITRWQKWFSIALSVAAAMILIGNNKPWFVPAALLGGWIYYRLSVRRYTKRKEILRRPFPGSWKKQLVECVPFYRKLDDEGKRRFEDDVRIFIGEQHIYGIRGSPVSDDVKVLIAASVAILGHGIPDWEWPDLRDIIVYPTNFNEDYSIRDNESMSGIVHQQGPIIFSEKDLKHGFCKPMDGHNVGLHELAHVMDMASGSADGVPAGLKWVSSAPWIRVMADRIQKIQRGDSRRVLRSYAGVNEAEFFAVAVEAFFEQPRKLKILDPELYGLLTGYFHLDPSEMV